MTTKARQRVCSNVAGNREALGAFLAGLQVDENIWNRFLSTELNDRRASYIYEALCQALGIYRQIC